MDSIIAWYQSLPPGHNELTAVMSARRQLSAIGIALAAYVGQLSRQSIAAEARRKIRFNAIREEAVSGGANVTAATSKAENEVAQLREEEAEAAGRYSAGRLLYDAVNNVLNSMAGEINFLSKELNTINHRE